MNNFNFVVRDDVLYYEENIEYDEHTAVIKTHPIIDKETFQKLILDWIVFDEDDTDLSLLADKMKVYLPFDMYKLRA